MLTFHQAARRAAANNLLRLTSAALLVGIAAGAILFPLTGWDWYNHFALYASNPANDPLHPAWIYLILGPLARLPFAFAWFTALNAILLITTVYLTKRPNLGAVITLPAFWILFYGQIDAWPVLGSVLGLWALKRNNPYLVGGAMLMLSAKPQIGVPLALYFLWQTRQVKSLVVPAAALCVSLLCFGFWPVTFVHNFLTLDTQRFIARINTVSFWPWALLILPPIFWRWRKLTYTQRTVAILTAIGLILPYSPIYSLASLAFAAAPLAGWWTLLLLPAWLGPQAAAPAGTVYCLLCLAYALGFKLKRF